MSENVAAKRRGRPRKTAEPAKTQPTEEAPAAEQPTKPEQPAEPYALVNSETVPMTYYRPVVQVMRPNPDGGETVETLECPHTRYWHESEKTAQACGRRLAAQAGVRIGSAG